MYTVVVGDLIHSAKIAGRARVAEQLRKRLKTASTKFKSDLITAVKLTKGMDELSGVLTSPGIAYRLCSHINEAIYPQRFRFVVVRGELDVGLDSHDAAILDGRAFHWASELITESKRLGRTYNFDLSGRGKPSFHDRWLTVTCNLIDFLLTRRTDRQREIWELYSSLGTQKRVAARLNISQQSISEALVNSQWDLVQEAESAVNAALSEEEFR